MHLPCNYTAHLIKKIKKGQEKSQICNEWCNVNNNIIVAYHPTQTPSISGLFSSLSNPSLSTSSAVAPLITKPFPFWAAARSAMLIPLRPAAQRSTGSLEINNFCVNSACTASKFLRPSTTMDILRMAMRIQRCARRMVRRTYEWGNYAVVISFLSIHVNPYESMILY